MEATVFRFTNSLEDPRKFLKEATKFVEENVSSGEKVVCALSGGVDSSTTAEIFRRAIGEKLYPLHFDTGFMRRINGEEEIKLVEENFKDFENFELIDKKETFYENIFGIEDAEEKRKSFRSTYEQVLNEKIEEIGATVMTQGTIRPDILETEGKIKSQNNVDTDFDVEKLVEPLAGLYKPDVRKLARELGFPEKKWMRQPFLGPGLSARTVGVVNRKKLENEKIANDLVEGFVERYFKENYGRGGLWDEVVGARIPFQYFAVTLDSGMETHGEINEYLRNLGLDAESFSLENKATGVKEVGGERERVYSPPVLLRGNLEPEVLHYLGREVPNRFGVSRVLFQLVRSEGADWIVGIRAVDSKDAITAEPLRIPLSEWEDLGEEITRKTDSKIVAYDLTPKPPATIEYE
ncbi:hypothetical protein AKJ57_03925 [candidate division MSBL1 archaeon SCGC-AAA259A05]|uniref:GMP synthase (glutamine-hydrolyzing) n=1 Tax=candidate division MSBL1 archaeon SCGC-AAA259A05 TaxID=1698259 RepID=A0A133U970_9EURY|nr:hypothetical protein AKJ57_03925 [candidate division MSBL1 archaeon SCGC-AAA259A05]